MLPNEHLFFSILKLNRTQGQEKNKKTQIGILQKSAMLM